MIKIVHIITSLDQGGAEAALCRLVTHQKGLHAIVVSLIDEGVYGHKLRSAGIEVVVLGMPRGKLKMIGLWRLYRLLRITQPDVVQTWMYHADLIGGVVAKFAGVANIVWGIHNFNLDSALTSLSARWAAWMCARLSRWLPSAIISCSESSARVHQALGYASDKFTVVPNGYDVARFSPDRDAGCLLRRQWKVAADTPLLGFVARWDPQKDHVNLLIALSYLMEVGQDFQCVLIGAGMISENAELMDQINKYGLRKNIILSGARDDIPAVMNALDIHVLSSAGEAFPNVVAEAMACGTPCVVTDVGDTALIVGDTGWCVPASNPSSLADALLQALNEMFCENWEKRSTLCRERIVEEFSIDKMAQGYLAVWEKLC